MTEEMLDALIELVEAKMEEAIEQAQISRDCDISVSTTYSDRLRTAFVKNFITEEEALFNEPPCHSCLSELMCSRDFAASQDANCGSYEKYVSSIP
jgi:hypothetical protein